MSNENNRENMDNEQSENASIPLVERSENPENNAEKSDLGVQERCDAKVNQLGNSTESGAKNAENTGIAIKNAESESLNSLLVYDSDSSSSSEMMKLNLAWQVRDNSDESSSSSSSSSSEDDSETESDDEPEPPQNKGAIRKDRYPPKPASEFDGLPPVPDLSTLNINVEDENFVHMGSILGIVDKLVTVAAIPNSPAYDLDTLLFLENGKKPLGFVFDVLGQVTSPIYAIRFNSVEDIKALQVEIGAKVYSAPKSKHTQYVFLQQLLKLKGSDASWEGDTECPPEFADYSDDENECFQRFGNKKLAPNIKRTHSGDNYKKFENTMNKRNLLNTKFNKYMDSYRQARFNKAKSRRPQAAPQITASSATFDPSVPPPTVRPMFYHHQQGAVFVHPEYMGMYYQGGENNNHNTPGYFMNNFVANLATTNSANYYTNHAGHNHPGPSHE